MAIGRKKPKFLCTCIIILTSLSFLVCGLYAEILDDTEYKVQYFRQNQDDRQLSIKLGVHGYLLVNADSSLCTQSDKCAFDEYGKNNYLLLIPDDTIIPSILCDKIKLFDKQYGIKKVFVPQTNEGRILGEALTLEGINCEYMPEKAVFNETTLTFNSNQNYHKITVDDEKEKTAIVFSDGYNADFFDDTSDICAFFTRKTKNQFQLGEDTPPKCDTFFTRLKKAESQGGFVNTFGKKSFYIKE